VAFISINDADTVRLLAMSYFDGLHMAIDSARKPRSGSCWKIAIAALAPEEFFASCFSRANAFTSRGALVEH
jgi:hypothetical protein